MIIPTIRRLLYGRQSSSPVKARDPDWLWTKAINTLSQKYKRIIIYNTKIVGELPTAVNYVTKLTVVI